MGFSFAQNGKCRVSDDETATENFEALLSFLEKFPEFEGRDLYLTGESYAGVYIPTLAYKIYGSNTSLKKMLKGIFEFWIER